MGEKRVTVWVQEFQDRDNLVLQWHDPDTGKRRSKSAGTNDPKEAEKARADLEYELSHGRYQEASRMTWDRFRELFEAEHAAGTRENTRKSYQATLDAFERLCKPKGLHTITERTISQFVAALRKEPGRARQSTIQTSTIKVRLQFLHTALSWAVTQKMLPHVPRFPTVKVSKKDPQPVAIEAFERLVNKAGNDQQMRAYLLCGWLAGLRLTEAYNLEREPTENAPYLDLVKDRIVLPAQIVKADRDQWIPLDPALRQTLVALPVHGCKVFRLTNRHGRPMTVGGVSQAVRQLAKKAGVKLTMKSMRRGFGCRYAGKVSAHVLQKLMRHASIKTTLDYYANIDAAVEEAVFGASRNTSRNTTTQTQLGASDAFDANHCLEMTSSPSADSAPSH
jgi:integrase